MEYLIGYCLVSIELFLFCGLLCLFKSWDDKVVIFGKLVKEKNFLGLCCLLSPFWFIIVFVGIYLIVETLVYGEWCFRKLK